MWYMNILSNKYKYHVTTIRKTIIVEHAYIIVFNCPCLCEIIYPFLIHSITWKSQVHIPHCPQLPVSSSCLAQQSVVAGHHLTYLSYCLCDYFEVRHIWGRILNGIRQYFSQSEVHRSHLHNSCVKFIFLYLKTRLCKFHALNIMYIKFQNYHG